MIFIAFFIFCWYVYYLEYYVNIASIYVWLISKYRYTVLKFLYFFSVSNDCLLDIALTDVAAYCSLDLVYKYFWSILLFQKDEELYSFVIWVIRSNGFKFERAVICSFPRIFNIKEIGFAVRTCYIDCGDKIGKLF